MEPVFAQEVPFQFLQIVSQEIKSTVSHIKQLVSAKISLNDSQFLPIYQKCLKTISDWNVQTKEQAFEELRQKFPYIQYLYEYTYFQFLKNVIGGKLQNNYTIPTIDELVYLFFVKASDATAIKSLAWENYSWDQLLVLFSTILRQVFLSCIQLLSAQKNEQATSPPILLSPAPSVMSLTAKNLKILEQRFSAKPQGLNTVKSIAEQGQIMKEEEEEADEYGEENYLSEPNGGVAENVKLIEESERDVENELAQITINNPLTVNTGAVTKVQTLP
jgi:hypothetical protein